jgi:hypothetical protein
MIGPLHLAYFATRVLLFRALMTPASMSAKNNPQSSLRRYFEPAVEQLGAFNAFMSGITVDGLRSFWGRRKLPSWFTSAQLTKVDARSQLILIGNFLIYLFLLSSGSEQVHATFRLLENFHGSLQRLSSLADQDSVVLIRPIALRIDSFFIQAAQIMRSNSINSITLDDSP